MSNSALINYRVDFGTKNSNPRKNSKYNPTGKVTVITVHHMAGKMTSKQCAEMHLKGNCNSANYYIGYDGDICLGVDEDRRAWTTGSRENDYKAVTIEVSNDINKHPWTVSEESFKSLIRLVTDICQRNDIIRLEFTGDKSGNLTMHRWFQATACPGDYLANRFPELANKVNELLGTAEAGSKLYKVQVGAFQNKSNATRLLNDLKLKGYNPFIVETEGK